MRPARVRITAAALLALYTAVIARLTLLPADSETGTFTLLDRVVTRLSNGGLDWTQIEALANVALFVPAGFLLAVVAARSWAGLVLGVLGSAAIEGAQYLFLPTRVPTLVDVEHNGLGALIGALVAWPLARWIRRDTRRSVDVAARPVQGIGASAVCPPSTVIVDPVRKSGASTAR